MKAMILAAGLGTRLRPLTDDRPKALVTVAGRTMLEIVLSRLRTFGVREVIVNVHHHADMVVDYLKANANFGMRIEVSREEELLDTGGGLKHAAWFFLDSDANLDNPFILHNVDILSTIDIGSMMRFHAENAALATVAVQHRETSRYLLFDHQDLLCGRQAGRNNVQLGRPVAEPEALAYSCIQILSPRIFAKIKEEGAFPIFDAYLRLAAEGEKIVAFRAEGAYWRDLGRPENVTEAARDIESGKYPGI